MSINLSRPKTTMDSASGFVGGGTESLMESQKYNFDSAMGVISVDDSFCIGIISIFNETAQKTLYVKGSNVYSGVAKECVVVVDVSTNSMSNDDVLFITYQTKETNIKDLLTINKNLLADILIEGRISNQIKREAYGSDVEASDVKTREF